MGRRGLRTALAASMVLAATAATGHPHVWVSVACVFTLDPDHKRLVSVRQEWTFDAMYSSYMVAGLDKDGDGRFSAEELAPLKPELTETAGAEGFYTKLALDDVETPVPPASDVDLAVDAHGALVVGFVQRFAEPLGLMGRSLRIEVRDPTFFVDFQFSKERFGVIEPHVEGCSASLRDSQPPAGQSPDDLMRSLIDGPVTTLASGVTLRCR